MIRDEADEIGERLLAEAGNGNIQAVRELIGRGANVNHPDEELGDRPLHRAAMEGRTETVRALLDLGADANAADNLGARPLHWAADGGHTEIIRLLVQNGAQATAENADGQTAADWADREGQREAAKFLRRLELIKRGDRQEGR